MAEYRGKDCDNSSECSCDLEGGDGVEGEVDMTNIVNMLSENPELRKVLYKHLSATEGETAAEKKKREDEESLAKTLAVAGGIMKVVKSFLTSLRKNDSNLPEHLQLYSTLDRASFLVDMSATSVIGIFSTTMTTDYDIDVTSHPEFEKLQALSSEISDDAAKLFSSLKMMALDLYVENIVRKRGVVNPSSCTADDQ